MQIAGAGSMAPAAMLEAAQVPAPPKEGPNTPKIALGMGDGGAARREGGGPPDRSVAPKRIKQLGVNHVLGGFGRTPWTEEGLKAMMEPWKAMGITVGNLMIGLSNDILYGKPGNKRDEDIEKIKQSIIAASKVGLPVIEYNFYAHRAMEGYFEEIDKERGDSGWTGFDFELVQKAGQPYQTRPEENGMKFKDLPPLPEIGAWTLDPSWAAQNSLSWAGRATMSGSRSPLWLAWGGSMLNS